MTEEHKTLKIENARIIFRNFSGVETKYNRAGNRNFCVIIDDPAVAGGLMEDGWNVRAIPPRDEDGDEQYYISVNVNFDGIRPPNIVMISGGVKTPLTEETVGCLDAADIRSVDLIINPYHWVYGGNSGIKGYLKTMYIVLEEDEFAAKYAEDVDDLPF